MPVSRFFLLLFFFRIFLNNLQKGARTCLINESMKIFSMKFKSIFSRKNSLGIDIRIQQFKF